MIKLLWWFCLVDIWIILRGILLIILLTILLLSNVSWLFQLAIWVLLRLLLSLLMFVQVIEPLLTSLIILKFKFWLVHVLLISILGGLSLNRVLFDWLVRLARISELRSAFVIEVEDLTIVLTSFSTEFVDFASTIALL